MTSYEFLIYLVNNGIYLPCSTEKSPEKASNSEVKRWLEKKSVIINGQKPGPKDIIQFPITELIFFPKGARRTTYLQNSLSEN